MAERVFMEGAEVLLGTVMSEEWFGQHYNNSEKVKLVSPLGPIRDIHLVLEYDREQQWGMLPITQRANRFYLNHDVDNPDFKLMEKFHEKAEDFKPQVLGLSGFQLMENSPSFER